MNDYLLSLLLGVIEGLTEFLPVSSTAHLRIAEALLQIDLKNGFWKMYSIVIQLGAILALTAFFWRRILKFLRTFPRGEGGDRTVLNHPLSLVTIAFLVTAIPAFLLTKLIGKNLENLYVMGFALLIGGIVMWIVDALFVRPRIQRMEETNLPTAIWIGAVQVLSAIFPGRRARCARSPPGRSRACRARPRSSFPSFSPSRRCSSRPATICSRRSSRIAATEAIAPLTMTPHLWIVLALGFVAAFVVAFAVVAWFLRWVRRHGFTPFAIYRIVLGLVLVLALARGLLGR